MRTLMVVSAVGLAATMPACARDQALPSKDQIVRATVGPTGRPLELLWAKTDRPWQDQEVFVTIHGRDSGGQPEHVAAVYRRVGSALERLVELRTDSSAFLEPTLFWAGAEGSSARERLIDISEILPGTGNLRQEHVFLIRSSGGLVRVEFVPAPTAFTDQLAPGEAVWKGEQNSFSDDAMAFTFFVWKEGDANCCPTAAVVTGTYKLEERGGRYRVIPQTYNRRRAPAR